MQAVTGGSGVLPPRTSARRRPRRLRTAARVLLVLGLLLIFAGALYLGAGRLWAWVETRDRYLEIGGIAPLQSPAPTFTALPTATPTPTSLPLPQPERASSGFVDTIVPLPTATFVPHPRPTGAPSPSPAPTLSPLPLPTALPPPAVRLRIPAIGVDRSIVELVPALNAATGNYELPLKNLFRRPGTDLVGHWAGSSNPGQPGNLILVGHNYGYGYNAVFVEAGRLKAGQLVYLVNQAGDTFTYQVTLVRRVKWSKKNEQELMLHQAYLSMDGEERVTLVTCGGATWEPFPDRVYVVAEPVR